MWDVVNLLILNALMIIGVHYSTYDGMIFNRLRNVKIPDWLQKPLYGCPMCMASVHSWPFFFFIDWYWWPAYVFALSGLVRIVFKWTWDE